MAVTNQFNSIKQRTAAFLLFLSISSLINASSNEALSHMQNRDFSKALKVYEDKGEFNKVKQLYKSSNFFKTLIENSMMSLSKSFFNLTKYMAVDEEFGVFWNIIHDEYVLSKRLILKLTGFKDLMQEEPAGKASIDIRESIVLPLLTIQQYALMKIQELKKIEQTDDGQLETYEKIVTRSLFGNINASRNSA